MAEKKSLDTMKLWDEVCVTDPKTTKDVSIGQRHFTAICAQSQIKKATELWGPFGSKWGVRNEEFSPIPHQDIKVMLYKAHLYYPNGIVEIHSDDEIIIRQGKKKDYYNEDVCKKIATDALTKGLSKLGFNADVFEGKFDDNKYVASLSGGQATSQPSQETVSETSTEDMADQAFGKLGDDEEAQGQAQFGTGPVDLAEEPQGRLISEKQGKRMYAIAMSNGWEKDDLKAVLNQFHFSSTRAVTADKYEMVCAVFEAGPA